ncbi:hypothetical protein CR513_26963, partial [Mucuna pruriens]
MINLELQASSRSDVAVELDLAEMNAPRLGPLRSLGSARQQSRLVWEGVGLTETASPGPRLFLMGRDNQASCALVFEIKPINIEEALKDYHWIIVMEEKLH